MRTLALLVLAAVALVSCRPRPDVGWQGYIEGDFVYVASPIAGRLEKLAVAKADVAAAAAAKQRADWNVEQKTQVAPRAGLIYDTLYWEGEYVTAGTPVIALLPPENIKVRFFVPETEFGALKAGDRVRVT